jgi:hypothetical protein
MGFVCVFVKDRHDEHGDQPVSFEQLLHRRIRWKVVSLVELLVALDV